MFDYEAITTLAKQRHACNVLRAGHLIELKRRRIAGKVALHTVQILVGRHLEFDREEDGQRPYNTERHQEVRRLTATIRGNLAAAIAAERDERG